MTNEWSPKGIVEGRNDIESGGEGFPAAGSLDLITREERKSDMRHPCLVLWALIDSGARERCIMNLITERMCL